MLSNDRSDYPDFNPYEDVEVGIEYISPAYAAKLQANNYEFNRDLIKANVNDLRKMMVDGKFVLSNDAVVIDSSGTVKNAQHRIEAIIQSGIGQWFVVMRMYLMTWVRLLILAVHARWRIVFRLVERKSAESSVQSLDTPCVIYEAQALALCSFQKRGKTTW